MLWQLVQAPSGRSAIAAGGVLLAALAAALTWGRRRERRRTVAAGPEEGEIPEAEALVELLPDLHPRPGAEPYPGEWARTPAGPGPELVAVDDAMDAYAFEQAVAALCVRDGCREVSVAGGAGDLGADVLAVCPDGRRVVIQCKRYRDTNKVGSEDLQRFGGTCFTVHEADIAVLVTTSSFTGPAVDYAGRTGIRCVDGEALAAWTDQACPPPWE
ncbi:restriction endonuclease [Streptomyces sp. PLAI1-29]|uniref:Restriction endonuclease n=2 Tax=Streptomyces zingiberis TaxID=2053010 RepID=A0ABX1C441_9ACTN|nr:restriction endonuclease [Streptomyces zingiberis]